MVTRKFLFSAISIHSLVKRETTESEFWMPDYGISIHSLVKRETTFFNSREEYIAISIHSLVKRETSFGCAVPVFPIPISIHSLVKRETSYNATAVVTGFDFNPLPRKEGD